MNSNNLPDGKRTYYVSLPNIDAFITEGLQRIGQIKDLAEVGPVSYGETIKGTEGQDVVPITIEMKRNKEA